MLLPLNVDQKHLTEYNDFVSTLGKSNPKVSEKAGLFIYSTVRAKKPNVVMETGVEDGFSTAIILNALNLNKKGKLISIEVSNDVGRLVKNMNVSRWQLRVGPPKVTLKNALSKEKEIDIFIHDSDHRTENIMFELGNAIKKMAKGGYIMCDDVQEENFMKFVSDFKLNAKLISSYDKTFGVVKLD